MRLVCPSCGALSSADSFLNDDLCRQALVRIAGLPGGLPQATLGYLALFRAGVNRALTWKKAVRLVVEIEELTSKSYVHVQGKVDKNCHSSLWARGMEQMVEQRNFLRLPMESHGYLQKVVWDLADKADYGQEVKRHGAGQQHQHVEAMSPARPVIRGVDPLQKARDEWDRTHGVPQTTSIDEISKMVGGIGNVKK